MIQGLIKFHAHIKLPVNSNVEGVIENIIKIKHLKERAPLLLHLLHQDDSFDVFSDVTSMLKIFLHGEGIYAKHLLQKLSIEPLLEQEETTYDFSEKVMVVRIDEHDGDNVEAPLFSWRKLWLFTGLGFFQGIAFLDP
ncbi:hypothetical protein Fmac_032375 [Flemingia macrophylla]|uniref:Uncharacterized protein n=1 Tax=Flemingia macrophylla TaxID=520843 RepID=A0ABD1L4R3_9FABA